MSAAQQALRQGTQAGMAQTYRSRRSVRMILRHQFLHQSQSGAAEVEFEEQIILVGIKEILDCLADAAPGDFPFRIVFAAPA